MALYCGPTRVSPSFDPKTPVSSPIDGEFDPRSMHPASMIPLKEMTSFTDRVVRKDTDGMHPASIPSPTQLIRDGYGELVLRVKIDDGSLRPVTKEEYAKAYGIFQKYAPRLGAIPAHLEKSRIAMMREELQKLIPNVVATFIPRTLHDLLFIRKSLEEDLERERNIPFKTPGNPTNAEALEFLVRMSKNSWFTNFATDRSGSFNRIQICTPSDVERNLPALVDIGYRLNLAASQEMNRIAANVEDLSLHQIQRLVDEQLEFLERFAKFPVLDGRIFHAKEDSAPLSKFFRGFAKEGLKTTCAEKMMSLRKIALLECQEAMAKRILCYRGGSLATDSPVKLKGTKNEYLYCISFGSAAFPGLINDRTACAYYHMFEIKIGEKEDAYILVLDPSQESAQTFYTPPYTALESFFGKGETWHYRFKISKDVHREVTGFSLKGFGFPDGMDDAQKLDLIKGPLTIPHTVDKFEDLKRNNVVLIFHKEEDKKPEKVGKKVG